MVKYAVNSFPTIYTDDPQIGDILEEYCNRKIFLWQWYFGWRSTNKHNVRTYLIPNARDFGELIRKIETYKERSYEKK